MINFGEDISYLGGGFSDFEEHGAPPCSETDPELFFPPDEFNIVGHRTSPTRNSSLSSQKGREAIKICNTCPYISECLNYAIFRPDLVGVWGGTTSQDRERIRKSSEGSIKTVKRQKYDF